MRFRSLLYFSNSLDCSFLSCHWWCRVRESIIENLLLSHKHTLTPRSNDLKNAMKVSDEPKESTPCVRMCELENICSFFSLSLLTSSSTTSILNDSMVWMENAKGKKRQTEAIDELIIYSWVERLKGWIDFERVETRIEMYFVCLIVSKRTLWQTNCEPLTADWQCA